MTHFIGVDPGLSGAVAVLSIEQTEAALDVWDMPTHEVVQNRKKRNVVDMHTLSRILAVDAGHAVIEQVNASMQMGVTSAFRFGQAFGIAQMAVVAAKHSLVFVAPRVWKRDFRLSSNKDEARELASRLMPSCADFWPYKTNVDRAEAALLAYWLAYKNFNLENLGGINLARSVESSD